MSRVLARALKSQGEPLPLPWAEIPVKPGPGDVVLGLAAPGVGKSFVALNWAVHLAKEGRPVLMISTDTDYSDQAIRTAALLSGKTTDEITWNQEQWAAWLHEVDLPIRWSELHIGGDEVGDFIKAEVEFLGQAPEFVVVDVAGDMLNGKEENVGNIRAIFTQLKKAARRFHTTIFVLHHVKRGGAASGTSTVRLSDGLYGGEQVCPIVLGMWRPGLETLTVAVLKNRMGPAHADGLRSYDLKADYPRALVASRARQW